MFHSIMAPMEWSRAVRNIEHTRDHPEKGHKRACTRFVLPRPTFQASPPMGNPILHFCQKKKKSKRTRTCSVSWSSRRKAGDLTPLCKDSSADLGAGLPINKLAITVWQAPVELREKPLATEVQPSLRTCLCSKGSRPASLAPQSPGRPSHRLETQVRRVSGLGFLKPALKVCLCRSMSGSLTGSSPSQRCELGCAQVQSPE